MAGQDAALEAGPRIPLDAKLASVVNRVHAGLSVEDIVGGLISEKAEGVEGLAATAFEAHAKLVLRELPVSVNPPDQMRVNYQKTGIAEALVASQLRSGALKIGDVEGLLHSWEEAKQGGLQGEALLSKKLSLYTDLVINR